MAHELGYLKHRHPMRLTRAVMLIYATIGLLLFESVRNAPAHANLSFALFTLLLVPATYFYTALSRRFERADVVANSPLSRGENRLTIMLRQGGPHLLTTAVVPCYTGTMLPR